MSFWILVSGFFLDAASDSAECMRFLSVSRIPCVNCFCSVIKLLRPFQSLLFIGAESILRSVEKHYSRIHAAFKREEGYQIKAQTVNLVTDDVK
jgi:hypothetical protein